MPHRTMGINNSSIIPHQATKTEDQPIVVALAAPSSCDAKVSSAALTTSQNSHVVLQDEEWDERGATGSTGSC